MNGKRTLKVNFINRKHWRSPMRLINLLPAIVLGALTGLLACVGLDQLSYVVFIVALVTILFVFLPFYLNGKVELVEEGIILTNKSKSEKILWKDIEKLDFFIVNDQEAGNNYVAVTIYQNEGRTPVVFYLMRHLFRGKLTMLTQFLIAIFSIPEAKAKLTEEVVKGFTEDLARMRK